VSVELIPWKNKNLTRAEERENIYYSYFSAGLCYAYLCSCISYACNAVESVHLSVDDHHQQHFCSMCEFSAFSMRNRRKRPPVFGMQE
jgi:hypothetical protein